MKENPYDNPEFFEKYSQMDRSKKGLSGAGEWAALKELLPDFSGKRVLDLGCGYGWHCAYAAEHGAVSVVGTDISEKMIGEAKKRNPGGQIRYEVTAFEDCDFPAESFDIIICSLMLHYLENYGEFLKKVSAWLKTGGNLIFNVEHPVFTAYGSQDWYYGPCGEILHFPVDRYFLEGKRDACFLGEQVVKYHRTLTTYLEGLLSHGFALQHVVEPRPTEEMLREIEGMEEELRRPMMLLVSAVKGR